MADDSPDSTYVCRAQAGHSEAFGVLVKRYEGMVFELTHRYSDRSADSEDLAQEIFLKAYRRLQRLEDPNRFASWLYTVAINHCRDYAKNVRRQTHPMSQTAYAYETGLEGDHSLEEHLEVQEESGRLWEAIEQLSPSYATPLLLKYRDGLSYRSISQRMDVSVSALKVRVHRARKKLKQLLADDL